MGDPRAAGALDLGILGLRVAYEGGLRPIDVVDEVLDRIARDGDPAIWIDVESAGDLHRAAKGLLRDASRDLPLWGVPFGVKDNIDVAGRTTTAGLPGLARRAGRSATVVERLVAAGALYVGKTNLDQLATGLVGTRSPFGTPINPIDPTHIPGGSSSGSAVAVARRQVPFALGTDTAGSGRVPAALCGIVGLKGAPGSRPIDGVLPASPSIDCVSTFARSVADGLVVESVLGGREWPVAGGPMSVGFSDLTLPEVATARAAGHAVSAVDLRLFHEAGDLLYGGAWLADRTSVLGPLLGLAGVDPTVRRVVSGGSIYRGTDVFEAQRRLRELVTELAPWWEEHDVLVVPTIEWAPTLAEVAADPIGTNQRLGRNTSFANLLGLAAITVPASAGMGGVTVLGMSGRVGAIAAIAGALRKETPASTCSISPGHHLLAVVGAHLTGQPLNHELTSRGAELVERTSTAPCYRLYLLDGGPPLRPGLDRVGNRGAEILVELWSLDDAALGGLTAGVAPPLGIGSVELSDGRWVKGFICESRGIAAATEITRHGGWCSFLAAYTTEGRA